jgi:hypothetical protein
MPYGIIDLANRSVKTREKFLALLVSTIDVFDRRSEISPDGLRYNQTNSFSYQSNYTLLLYLIKIGVDSGCITKTEGGDYIERIFEAHYENLLFEISYPPVDYSKAKVKAKREPKEKKPRETKPKAAKSSKVGIDFSNIAIKLNDIL